MVTTDTDQTIIGRKTFSTGIDTYSASIGRV